MELTLKPWAKINLHLQILGEEKDGYHSLRTLMQPIDLRDELQLQLTKDKGILLDYIEEELPIKSSFIKSEDNLVVKAARLFFSAINKKPSICIKLKKRIPIGGGLGGGSSDAASTLRGLNELFNYPLDDKKLYELASSLGMDVGFFLEVQPAVCSGRGEKIEERWDSFKYWVVLVNPRIILSTADVYREFNNSCKITLTTSSQKYNILEFLRDIYNKKVINNVYIHIKNDLQDSAVKLCSQIGTILDLFSKTNAVASFVCGSGATVCGLSGTEEDARKIEDQIIKRCNFDIWTKVVPTI